MYTLLLNVPIESLGFGPADHADFSLFYNLLTFFIMNLWLNGLFSSKSPYLWTTHCPALCFSSKLPLLRRNNHFNRPLSPKSPLLWTNQIDMCRRCPMRWPTLSTSCTASPATATPASAPPPISCLITRNMRFAQESGNAPLDLQILGFQKKRRGS